MIQTENLLQNVEVPEVEIPEAVAKSDFWSQFKGLGFEDIIEKVTQVLVNFGFKILLAILVFYVGRFIIKKLYKLIFNMMTSRHIDASLTTFILSLVRMTLYFILIITVIGILGIETSSFLAIFASAGVAIGLALSGTLQNFAGGVLILLLKPYKVGDFVEVSGYTGTVKSIQLFNTIINTIDNKAIIIPNGTLSTSSINNYSVEPYRRVDWSVSLAYGTDLAAAKEAILAMLNEDDRIVRKINDEMRQSKGVDTIVHLPVGEVDRRPFVGLSEMADSAIVLTVRAWTEAANYWDVYFEMNERLYTELPKKGFSFPFPQMDVHMVK
jgi:small conductance mechanosensitive channel